MKKVDSMNLIPFIDIMLVLLVIVMTSATFVNTSKIPIDIPQIQNDGNSKKDLDQKEIIISISKDGNFYLGDEILSFNALSTRMGGIDKKTHIIVKGDKKSQLDKFVEVMQMLQSKNLSEIYVLVENKAQ